MTRDARLIGMTTEGTKEIFIQILQALHRHERRQNELRLEIDCILAALPKEQHDKVEAEMKQRGLSASTRILHTLDSVDTAIQKLREG